MSYDKKNYDKAAYKEQMQELAKVMQEKVANYATRYTTSPENLAGLAAFKAKFYNYSFKNTMLIALQNPLATFVGSFDKFKKIGQELTGNLPGNYGYIGVKKGEKGMKIFVPVRNVLVLVDEKKQEWKRVSELNNSQKQLYEAGRCKTRETLSYKVGTVFDISQTNIPTELYPEVFSMGYNSKQHKTIFEGLKKCIEEKFNCPVKINIDNSISLRGVCKFSSIELNSKLKDTEMLSTLSHEFGHFLMHNDVMNTGDENLKEVEADIYGIMLEARFGIEPTDVRKAHLANSFLKSVKGIEDESERVKVLDTAFNKASTTFAKSIEAIEEAVAEVSAQQAAAANFEISQASAIEL